MVYMTSIESINDIIRMTKSIEDFPEHKHADMVDALFTLVESMANGNIDLNSNKEIIVKRIMSDELMLVVNENNFNYIFSLIEEAVLSLSDLMIKYDLFERDVIVYEVSLELNRIGFEYMKSKKRIIHVKR